MSIVVVVVFLVIKSRFRLRADNAERDGGFGVGARFCCYSKMGSKKKEINVRFKHQRVEKGKTQRGISRTYEDGADEWVVQNPSDGNVGNAHTTVAVADSS